MKISFELVDIDVGVDDLVDAVSDLNVSTRVATTLSLGKHGPRPVLQVVFESMISLVPVREEIADRLRLAGIEVADE